MQHAILAMVLVDTFVCHALRTLDAGRLSLLVAIIMSMLHAIQYSLITELHFKLKKYHACNLVLHKRMWYFSTR
jgi:hypothetical protein